LAPTLDTEDPCIGVTSATIWSTAGAPHSTRTKQGILEAAGMGLEARELTLFLERQAKEHAIGIPGIDLQDLAGGLCDYWYATESTRLVQDLHLGYMPSAQTFFVLVLLTENWSPGPAGPPTPEQQRHRELSRAESQVWHQHPALRIGFRLAFQPRFPHPEARAILARVTPKNTTYLGRVPLAASAVRG
ncbi:MAG: hypothetical protein ACR2PL_26240, partial [Dehalococcoidia bacterium]